MKMLDLVLLGSFEEALMFSPQLGDMQCSDKFESISFKNFWR